MLRYTNKKAHQRYFLQNGQEVTGASTYAKVTDEVEPFIWYGWNLGIKGLDFRKYRDADAEAGNVAHFMVHAHFKGEQVDYSEVAPATMEVAKVVFGKFQQWWESENLTFLATEMELSSELYGYGGTLDVVAEGPQGRIWLLDIKTSKRVYNGHRCQVAAYAQLWDENSPDRKVHKAMVLRLGRKPKDKIDPCLIYNVDEWFATFLSQKSYIENLRIATGE